MSTFIRANPLGASARARAAYNVKHSLAEKAKKAAQAKAFAAKKTAKAKAAPKPAAPVVTPKPAPKTPGMMSPNV